MPSRSPRKPLAIVIVLLAAVGLTVTGAVRYTGQQRLIRRLQAEIESRPPRPDALRRLLDRGADPHTLGANGKTVLMAAAEADAPDLVTRALNLGLPPSDRDTAGVSALEYAVNAARNRSEPTVVVQTLVDHGADLNGVTMAFGGPLFTAATYGESEVVKILVMAGADVNQQDHQGYTALFHAALAGQARTVETLLTLGADPFLRARDGLTVVEEARRSCAGRLKALRKAKTPSRELEGAERTCREVLQLLR